MPGPLDGFKVIDLTTMVSGPLGTMILADQGADVIKVETPEGGDHTRQVATRRNGFSASFLNNNRNKRSIALNLKTPEGLAAVKHLARDADVFIQNFRPGVIDRLGLGYEALRGENPKLVYASISGFGFEGPFAQKPVFDPLVQCLSGLTTVQAGADEERPRLVRTILPDKLTGFTMAQAICAALLARSRSGEGQHIKLSMLDTVLSFLWGSDMGGHTFVGDEMEKETAQSFIDLIYETRDGYISVAVMRHKEWCGLARAAERPEWLDDPRFQNSEGLDLHKHARLALTQEALRERTSAEWIERLEAEGVPCAPVLTRREAIRHPQAVANGIVMESDHPVAGRLRQARSPAVFSATPPDHRFGAPALGGHTREILSEAGYDDAAIDAMIENGSAAETKTRSEDAA
ncbi:CoA transferase [Pelagibius litoralis]|uniref:CoA transferase n=1 Tax=Pelagibius litoralis TaxID=374515 RepID=A0A967EZ10_9PROT|nr:CoA transferase [Pelagibius litoralis]NIA69965.1 CoA transferase [Pelagibius litoralis]